MTWLFKILYCSTLTSSGLRPHALTWTLTEWLSKTSGRVWKHHQTQGPLDYTPNTIKHFALHRTWCFCHSLCTTNKWLVCRSFKPSKPLAAAIVTDANEDANSFCKAPSLSFTEVAKHKHELTVSWMTNLSSVSLTPARQYKPFILFERSCKEKFKRH